VDLSFLNKMDFGIFTTMLKDGQGSNLRLEVGKFTIRDGILKSANWILIS
jgi:hypothetical protein